MTVQLCEATVMIKSSL